MVHSLIFFNNKHKIMVLPLPTGCGKSTISELTLAKMYIDEEFMEYSGTIILKLTKDDCNVTANNINKFADKDIAYAYHTGDFNDKKSDDITLEELQQYPILVMTHEGYKTCIANNQQLEKDEENKLKSKKSKRKKAIVDYFNWTDKKVNKSITGFNVFDRERLIIDEEISNVEAISITMNTLQTLENVILNMGNNNLFNEFMGFINKVKEKFIKSYTEKANMVYFITFDDICVPDGLDEAIFDYTSMNREYKVKECYLHLLNLINNGGYVRYAQELNNKCIITYKYIDIYNPRFKKIQLDATANVNELYTLNPNYIIAELPLIKTYRNTYIHIYDKVTGSRSSLIEHFDKGLLEACYSSIENKLNDNEKGLVIFNNPINENAFLEYVRDKELITKHKIFILHYGLTCGTNFFKDYDKCFVFGNNIMNDAIYPLLYHCHSEEMDFNKYDTSLIPVKGARVYKEERFENLRKSLVASSLIQALNRIKIRKYKDGDTLETHLFIINSDKEVDELLKQYLPDVNILYDWDISYKPEKKESKSKTNNTQVIIDALKFIIENPKHEDVIKLWEDKVITDKGLNKVRFREVIGINNRHTFLNAIRKPIFKQFCDDYKLSYEQILSADKTIKL